MIHHNCEQTRILKFNCKDDGQDCNFLLPKESWYYQHSLTNMNKSSTLGELRDERIFAYWCANHCLQQWYDDGNWKMTVQSLVHVVPWSPSGYVVPPAGDKKHWSVLWLMNKMSSTKM